MQDKFEKLLETEDRERMAGRRIKQAII
jgi:hypothetical protein